MNGVCTVVLGELEGAGHDEIRRAIEESAELQEVIEQIRETVDSVKAVVDSVARQLSSRRRKSNS